MQDAISVSSTTSSITKRQIGCSQHQKGVKESKAKQVVTDIVMRKLFWLRCNWSGSTLFYVQTVKETPKSGVSTRPAERNIPVATIYLLLIDAYQKPVGSAIRKVAYCEQNDGNAHCAHRVEPSSDAWAKQCGTPYWKTKMEN